MRDYEELTRRLRACESVMKEAGVASVRFACADAADAIEELLIKAGLWHRRYQLEHENVEKLRAAEPPIR